MNKRMFTKKFFVLDFPEKIHGAVNKFFFEKILSNTSLFKKKCYFINHPLKHKFGSQIVFLYFLSPSSKQGQDMVTAF